MSKEDDRIPNGYIDKIHKRVSDKFDKLNAFGKIGASSLFGWMPQPAKVQWPEKAPVMWLYIPTHAAEYDLIRISKFTKFFRSKQDFFYPYSSAKYASALAQCYSANRKTAFVLKVKIKRSFMRNYDAHNVCDGQEQGFMVPSSDIDLFNQNIIGHIVMSNMFIDCNGGLPGGLTSPQAELL